MKNGEKESDSRITVKISMLMFGMMLVPQTSGTRMIRIALIKNHALYLRVYGAFKVTSIFFLRFRKRQVSLLSFLS